MRPLAKAGLIGAGYLGAVAVAAAVVAVYAVATDNPDKQNYSGMVAFGESLLFLAVFGVASVVPTGAALFFLRPRRSFWRVLSVAALVVAATAVAALFDYLAEQRASVESVASVWSLLAVLRILVAPLFALSFLVAAVMAPSRNPRLALLAATAMEAAAFVSVVAVLVHAFASR